MTSMRKTYVVRATTLPRRGFPPSGALRMAMAYGAFALSFGFAAAVVLGLVA